MDKAKAGRLSRLLLLDRACLSLPFSFAIIALLALGGFFVWDSHVSERTLVHGTVDSWSLGENKERPSTLILWVTLADGSKVRATAEPDRLLPPARGDRIALARTRSVSGRVRYKWTLDPGGSP